MRPWLLIFAVTCATPAYAANLTVTNLADSGAGSLRAVLTTAMGNAEPDQITFSVSGTIPLQSPLGALGDPGCSGAQDCLVIDGRGTIVLDGSSIPRPNAHGYGFELGGPGFTITELTLSGFEHAAVLIDGMSAYGNRVINCFIGTDSTGQNVNASTLVGDAGVLIRGGANGNEIIDNTIAGYTSRTGGLAAGAHVMGSQTDGNRFLGNVIGLAAGGTAPVVSTGHVMDVGIWIDGGAIATQIGLEMGAGNVIGNQGLAGILIEGTGTDALVAGNWIGTDATGTVEMPNGTSSPESGGGVVIRNGPQGCSIGEVTMPNVISGNRNCQVRIANAGPGNEVFANIIGAAGTALTQPLVGYAGGNAAGNINGVCLEGGAHDAVVGRGASPLEANRFAYLEAGGSCPPACGAAVLLTGTTTSMNNISGNYIGTRFDDQTILPGSAPTVFGILVTDGANRNMIGLEPNIITATSRAAIAVVGASSTGNALMRNFVSGNGTERTPGVEVCLARDFDDCRAHGYQSDPTRGNGGILPPRFDAGAFFPTEPGITRISGTVESSGLVMLFRVPLAPSDSGQGGSLDMIAELPIPVAPFTFSYDHPIDLGTSECLTAVFISDGAYPNGSELAPNIRVVGDPQTQDDDGSAGACRPTPPPTDPTETDTRCTSGFRMVDGVCTRDLGCAAVTPPGLAALLAVIWARRRRRA